MTVRKLMSQKIGVSKMAQRNFGPSQDALGQLKEAAKWETTWFLKKALLSIDKRLIFTVLEYSF